MSQHYMHRVADVEKNGVLLNLEVYPVVSVPVVSANDLTYEKFALYVRSWTWW